MSKPPTWAKRFGCATTFTEADGHTHICGKKVGHKSVHRCGRRWVDEGNRKCRTIWNGPNEWED